MDSRLLLSVRARGLNGVSQLSREPAASQTRRTASFFVLNIMDFPITEEYELTKCSHQLLGVRQQFGA
jgi:hypothetical protein